MSEQSRVFLVDDDPAVLRALERLIRSAGFAVEAFESPISFLERVPYHDGTACLVLDLQLPGLSGLDLQNELVRRGRPISIVFLSGTGDIPSATKAMRGGALDFLVKPVDEPQLLDAVSRALIQDEQRLQAESAQREVDQRMARLTKREREVCALVARGLLNKQIASELGTSEKTVKVHRGRMMRKLEVDSVAALVLLCVSSSRGGRRGLTAPPAVTPPVTSAAVERLPRLTAGIPIGPWSNWSSNQNVLILRVVSQVAKPTRLSGTEVSFPVSRPMPSRSSKMILVVVDDDRDIRRALERLLRSYGHEVHVFESAEAFLAQNSAADCAILDIELPGLSGLELEERMTQEGRGIPVVFITAHRDLALRAAARRTHRPFLEKPIDEDGLLDAIALATSQM